MELENIHSDARGFIKAITGQELTTCPEITIMKTRAGFARGGCIHLKSKEHLVVIEGTINYYWGTNPTINRVLTAGESITTNANIPHYFLSLTDSIVAEFGPAIDEKQDKFQPMRDIVNSINKLKETTS